LKLRDMPSMPPSKSVKWASAAEARDADTGEVEPVALNDLPSQIRLKCVADLKEARAQQSQSGVTFCERALEAAEAAESEDRLQDAEQILELIIGHLQEAMATPDFQAFLASLRAQQAHDRWAGDDARERERRQLIQDKMLIQGPAGAAGAAGQAGQQAGKQEGREGDARQGQPWTLASMLPPPHAQQHGEGEGGPPTLTSSASSEELEASEEESRGLLADVARGTHGSPVTTTAAMKRREGEMKAAEASEKGAGAGACAAPSPPTGGGDAPSAADGAAGGGSSAAAAAAAAANGKRPAAENDENAAPAAPARKDGNDDDDSSDEDVELGRDGAKATKGVAIEDQLPDEFVLMAHACFLAARWGCTSRIQLYTQLATVCLTCQAFI
jgi:hypothetical protein